MPLFAHFHIIWFSWNALAYNTKVHWQLTAVMDGTFKIKIQKIKIQKGTERNYFLKISI